MSSEKIGEKPGDSSRNNFWDGEKSDPFKRLRDQLGIQNLPFGILAIRFARHARPGDGEVFFLKSLQCPDILG